MQAIMKTLGKAISRKSLAASGGYYDLVFAVVQAQDVDADALAVAIEEAGKSPEDFESDYEQCKRRIDFAAKVVGQESARRAYEEAAVAKAQLSKDWDKATAKFRTRMHELEEQSSGAQGKLTAAQVAERRLQVDIPAWLQEAIDDAAGEASQARRTVNELRSSIAENEGRLLKSPDDYRAGDWRRRIHDFEERLKEAERLAKEATDYETRLREISLEAWPSPSVLTA